MRAASTAASRRVVQQAPLESRSLRENVHRSGDHQAEDDQRDERLERYVDYLVLGFTTSTAFSPTDVMPMSPWASRLAAVSVPPTFLYSRFIMTSVSSSRFTYCSPETSRTASLMVPPLNAYGVIPG
jgi:hypothetical protein